MSDNLISLADRSEDERREIARLGGLASGEARRKRRSLREELEVLLTSGNAQERICTALIEKAAAGNERAFAILRDSIGERPTESTEIKAECISSMLTGEEKAEALRIYLEELRNKN